MIIQKIYMIEASHNEFYEKNTRKNPSNDIFNKTKLCFRTPNLRLNILNSIVQEEGFSNNKYF